MFCTGPSFKQLSESHAKEKTLCWPNLLAMEGFTNICDHETETGHMTTDGNIFTVFVVLKYQIRGKQVY
jgi:hypothetical protein